MTNNNPNSIIDEVLPLEQQLWAAYRLGHAAGIKKVQPVQYITPTCPVHFAVPLWTETQPKPDGSWLYCPFCRENQWQRETEHMQPVQPQTRQGYYSPHSALKTRLTSPKDDWLNSDPSEDMTVLMRAVRVEK